MLMVEQKRYGLLQFLRIKAPEVRNPLLLAMLIMVAQQFTGVAAVFAYSTDMFKQADLTIDKARLVD